MSSSDVSSVVNYFPFPNEGFTTTLGSTISSGASTVPLNATGGLTTGQVFVGIIEPGATNQQVFTGTVDIAGSQITGVKWTRGTNVGHAGGVTIVDYVTGTAIKMMTTGFLKQHTQTGTHQAITTDTLAVSTTSAFTGAMGGTGYSLATISNPYKFSVYRNAAVNASTNPLVFDTKTFDTGSNYSVSTGKFTAPIAGFYQFNVLVTMSANAVTGYSILLVQNSTTIAIETTIIQGTNSAYGLALSKLVQLAANDTVNVNTTGTVSPISPGASTSYFEGFLVSAT